jgi:outer membrane protein assembly factor BamA
LEYFRLYKNIKFLRFLLIALLIIIVVSSCNPTKYVAKDESLLVENKIAINTDSIKKKDIQPYIKQKPNKRILGVRFHLGLYDISNIKKERWPHSWLRNIGEEPVIFDPYATTKSKEQIKGYLSSKGYFDSRVSETIETANKRTRVYYNIDAQPAYTIRNLYYEISDTGLTKIVAFDSINCLIVRGRSYDADLLQSERSRLERAVRDMGYYGFSVDNISFRIDSTIGNRKVDIYYGIKKFLRFDSNNNPVLVPNSQYQVRNIYIYADYFPKDVLAGGEAYQKSLDTVNHKGYFFITNLKRPTINYDVITQALYIKPEATFNVSNTERSQAHLMSFKTYRLVNIRYNDPDANISLSGEVRYLDCIIQLTPMSKQSFAVELEGTNSGGNLGGALNFLYQNKNLLHGAEQFNLKLKGAYEAFSQTDSSGTVLKTTRQFGVETSLRLPSFFLPFIKKERFVKKYNPTTAIQMAYNYQNLPVYTRTVANAAFGYTWKAGDFQTHIINPFQLSLVRIPFIDTSYYNRVIKKSSYLLNSYKDVLIAGGNYSFIFNNQKIKKARDNWFVRINFEAAGNLLQAFNKLTNGSVVTDTIKTTTTSFLTGDPVVIKSYFNHFNIFKQPFAQFVRTDIDVRYNRIINDVSSIVYRGFIGVGVPYGNSLAMPFEKQYFEGGANGIRGWAVRSLGPGSYNPPPGSILNYQTGDIKIEANIEYRFRLFWVLEGALFVDAGNIWAIRNDNDRPGAQFKFNTFYKDIAVGSGFGMRFDFKFVLLRTDIGLKVRNPREIQNPDGSVEPKWLFNQVNPINRNNLAFVLAIGYPF